MTKSLRPLCGCTRMRPASWSAAELSAGTFCTFRRELSSWRWSVLSDVRRTCNVLDDLTLSGVTERLMIVRMPTPRP
jgi:hypothetical protein